MVTGADDDVADAIAEAADALTRFGLTSYQARAYVAAHSLGSATARRIADRSGVPRERVYDAMNDLHGRGLVDVQQSTPRVYRAVGTNRLFENFEDEYTQSVADARDSLGSLDEHRGDEHGDSEGIWVVRERDRVLELERKFVKEATEQVFFGAATEEVIEPETVEAFHEVATETDVEVIVESPVPGVTDKLVDGGALEVMTPRRPWQETPELDGTVGRILIVDETTVLVSTLVYSGEDGRGTPEESAVWSRGGGAGDGFVITLREFMLDRVEDRVRSSDE